MTPEGKIKDMVKRKMVSEFDNPYRFMPVQSGYGAPSLDFLYCVEGLFVAIETKAPGGKMTPRQESTAEAIRAAGGLVFVVDSVQSMNDAVEQIRAAVSAP